MFSQSGKELRKLCSEGEGPGQLSTPTGLAFCRSGNLLCCDFERVQVLTTEGKFICQFGIEGIQKPESSDKAKSAESGGKATHTAATDASEDSDGDADAEGDGDGEEQEENFDDDNDDDDVRTWDPDSIHVDWQGRIVVGSLDGSVHVFAYPL